MAYAMLMTFALTLFFSASLLFLVQPLVGKLLLPYMGGTPAIWNTCMVFFQGLLLAGYAYAHGLTRVKEPRRQLFIHACVLLVPILPLFLLQFDVGRVAAFWPAPSEANPIPWLLMVLLVVAGLPFFVVSATAPLLQKWFATSDHPAAKDPYFLYGASNVGSMGSLLCYPALIEPGLLLSQQTIYWAFGYVILAGLVLYCGWLAINRPAKPAEAEVTQLDPDKPVPATTPPAVDADAGRIPSWFDRVRWVLLAFVPSSVMIGCTTHLTTDIAPVPLLWILPLALYLASFIFVFSRLPLWLNMSVALILPVVLIGAMSGSRLEWGSWAGVYESTKIVLNQPFEHFALHHLLAFGLVGVLVATSFRNPQTIHTLMVVLAPLAGLAIAFEWELRRFFEMRTYEQIILHLGVLFVVAMVCHGELARTRPRTQFLTEFYLLMSLGGVLGGMFNTLLAPFVYDRIWEYPLVVAFALLLMPWPGQADEKGWENGDSWTVAVFGAIVGIFLVCLFVAQVTLQSKLAYAWAQASMPERLLPVAKFLTSQLPGDEGVEERIGGDWTRSRKVLYRERNFFGTFIITEVIDRHPTRGEYTYHSMYHGTTTHGMQIMKVTDPFPDRIHNPGDPLTYFHSSGPIGDLFTDRYLLDRPLKMAILGVGTGTLACYAKKDWEMTLFEIDPAVVRVAMQPVKVIGESEPRQLFTQISDAVDKKGAKVEVILGDGRQMFKKAEDGKFDLIFMDAFTSDAVPIHLLTKEATEMYLEKLAPGGLIIFNVANRYLTFEPLFGNLCEKLGLSGYIQYGEEDRNIDKFGSIWVVIGKKDADLGTLPTQMRKDEKGEMTPRWKRMRTMPSLGVWTDDYANLLSVFTWTR